MTTDTALQSERLILEKINASQAEDFKRALCDPKVYQHIDTSCPTLSELHDFLRELEGGPPKHQVDEFWHDFAVRRTADRQLIGRLEASIISANAEVSYLFGSDFWGQGYASESLHCLQRFINNNHHVTSYWACISPSNLRSIKLIKLIKLIERIERIERMGYSEASPKSWPSLITYDSGDRVFQNQGPWNSSKVC